MKTILIFFALFATSPCAAQWRFISGGLGTAGSFLAFGVHHDTLFASVNGPGGGAVGRYVAPQNWAGASSGIDFTQGNITSFASLGRYFFAGNNKPGTMWRTESNGGSWQASAAGNVCTSDRYVLCAPGGIYRSADSGAYNPWSKVSSFNAINLFSNGTCIFATGLSAVWRSEDTGNTWSQISVSPVSTINSLAFISTITFGANGKIIKSTDSGSHWTDVSIPNRSASLLVSDSTWLFAGTDSGVYVSLDSGKDWREVSQGLASRVAPPYGVQVTAMVVFDTMLVAGLDEGDGYGYAAARPIREMVDTNPSNVVEQLPSGDSIEIYPNPTLDRISILAGGTSVLGIRILNVLGSETGTGFRGPGSENVELDLSKLPSGTYFLEIETAQAKVLRKIVKE